MAYCTEYEKIENDEQAEFLARLIHIVQKDSYSFRRAAELISGAYARGLFDKVKFGRDALMNEQNKIYNEPALTTDTAK